MAELGAPVVALLNPQAGERVLDLGCGDGVLTEKLIPAGCQVVGIDGSEAQVEAARRRGVDARVMDAHALPFDGEFDAVFSNAALHWMKDPGAVIDGVWRSLVPGGRFVGEMGGRGNVAKIVGALEAALRRRGIETADHNPWYFPDTEEFVARVLVQIPDPRRHLARYYGAYSNRARGQRRKKQAELDAHPSSETSEEPVPTPPERAALRRRWANLIRGVYEVDPLVCPRCGAEMRVIGFITEPRVIKRILDHIRTPTRASRPPPRIGPPLVPQPAARPA